MNTIRINGGFECWREKARCALLAGIAPENLAWEDEQSATPASLLEELIFREAEADQAFSPRVPPQFLDMARRVSCHRNVQRWPTLYRVLWRLTQGQRYLLEVATDPDVNALQQLDKQVRRAIHKMRAFVRFRLVKRGGRDWFVAWFEPDHPVVRLNAEFFVDRFARMRWSILTPDESVHWDGRRLEYTPGVKRDPSASPDALENLWQTYYAAIFNPARLKPKAMRAEMPKKFWRNLPEAPLIPALLREAPGRVETMLKESRRRTVGHTGNHQTPDVPETYSLSALQKAAKRCAACPHAGLATQTVFGAGNPAADVVLLGEQPGDREDRQGTPFVGPAGQLLDRALTSAGLDRDQLYLTNAVKHFKWEPQGKRRLHRKPSARDIECCRSWLEAELRVVQPRILICLGASAAQAVFGPAATPVRESRGEWKRSAHAPLTMITVHPSAILRIEDGAEREAAFNELVKDLSRVREAAIRPRREEMAAVG
ncbi:MAG TPA: UdgX family uracil-DNA binding protein [Chthoniobacterales bacterium]